MNIEMYSKTACPFCDQADFLIKKQIEGTEHTYTKLMLDVDFDRQKLLEIAPTARTFPQIFIQGENIGGFTELKKLVDDHPEYFLD